MPDISLVIPVRNEARRLPATLRSIARGRTTEASLEVVLVDDASDDGGFAELAESVEEIAHPRMALRVVRLEDQVGVPRARNFGVRSATGDIVFITDAHIRLSHGWDRELLANMGENRVLCGSIVDPNSRFQATGCNLIVPFMGTWWNRGLSQSTHIQVASSSATVLRRELFHRIGGYDDGMLFYGGAEPEFSVRAWMSDVEIVAVPTLKVFHRFKPADERNNFIDKHRTFMEHNCLRFGMLYLSEFTIWQMVRHHAIKFPDHIAGAFDLVLQSDVWERRRWLSSHLAHDFEWFVRRFNLKNQIGQPIV